MSLNLKIFGILLPIISLGLTSCTPVDNYDSEDTDKITPIDFQRQSIQEDMFLKMVHFMKVIWLEDCRMGLVKLNLHLGIYTKGNLKKDCLMGMAQCATVVIKSLKDIPATGKMANGLGLEF